jgi:predicted nucleic acid-binding protein
VIYFDTSYLVRLYFDDPGFEIVRDLAATDHLACAFHGQAETISALHRKHREGALTQHGFHALLDQFEADNADQAINWIPTSNDVLSVLREVYRKLPASIYLRAADATHLATAASQGYRAIYSNDSHLLAAASAFGLQGTDVL